MKEATKIMGDGTRFYALSDLHRLIEKYFVILYTGDWPRFDKKIQRVIKEELCENVDYFWQNGNRVMNEAQALRFVTQNASIRKYFLKVMADNPREIEKYFHDLDGQLLARQFDTEQDAEQGEERPADTGATSSTEEDILSGRIVGDYAKRILLDMLADTSADALYDYFGIDREAFTSAYLEYKRRLRDWEFIGVSELRYKLARPTIYYALQQADDHGDESEDEIK